MRYISLILLVILFTSCAKNSVQYTPTSQSSSIVSFKRTKIQQQNIDIVNTQKINNSIPTVNNNTEIPSDINISNQPDLNQLALIIPSAQIGKYAKEAINITNTYILYKNKPITLKVFDISIQTKQTLQKVFNKIYDQHITKVVAMLTIDKLNFLNNIDLKNIKIYLPLINKNEVKSDIKLNLIFGAISYKDQFKKLIKYVKYKKIVNFYDNSSFGYELNNYMKQYKLRYSKKVDNNNRYYSKFLRGNRRLRGSNIFLNTPIVKSSILLSQIDGYSIPISHILSTQLNYTPLIFSLTQKSNRKLSIIIANSIGYIPPNLLEYSKLYNNHLQYNWVNYSIIVGLEYLLEDNINLFKDIKVIDNQVIYPIYLYKVRYYSFKKIG